LKWWPLIVVAQFPHHANANMLFFWRTEKLFFFSPFTSPQSAGWVTVFFLAMIEPMQTNRRANYFIPFRGLELEIGPAKSNCSLSLSLPLSFVWTAVVYQHCMERLSSPLFLACPEDPLFPSLGTKHKPRWKKKKLKTTSLDGATLKNLSRSLGKSQHNTTIVHPTSWKPILHSKMIGLAQRTKLFSQNLAIPESFS